MTPSKRLDIGRGPPTPALNTDEVAGFPPHASPHTLPVDVRDVEVVLENNTCDQGRKDVTPPTSRKVPIRSPDGYRENAQSPRASNGNAQVNGTAGIYGSEKYIDHITNPSSDNILSSMLLGFLFFFRTFQVFLNNKEVLKQAIPISIISAIIFLPYAVISLVMLVFFSMVLVLYATIVKIVLGKQLQRLGEEAEADLALYHARREWKCYSSKCFSKSLVSATILFFVFANLFFIAYVLTTIPWIGSILAMMAYLVLFVAHRIFLHADIPLYHRRDLSAKEYFRVVATEPAFLGYAFADAMMHIVPGWAIFSPMCGVVGVSQMCLALELHGNVSGPYTNPDDFPDLVDVGPT